MVRFYPCVLRPPRASSVPIPKLISDSISLSILPLFCRLSPLHVRSLPRKIRFSEAIREHRFFLLSVRYSSSIFTRVIVLPKIISPTLTFPDLFSSITYLSSSFSPSFTIIYIRIYLKVFSPRSPAFPLLFHYSCHSFPSLSILYFISLLS